MKAQTHTVHWKAISLGVMGLIVGYSMVIAKEGKIAFTEKVQCPMKNHAVCMGGNCGSMPSCSSGVCSASCPGNCHNNPPA